jgi:hypothetical protein
MTITVTLFVIANVVKQSIRVHWIASCFVPRSRNDGVEGWLYESPFFFFALLKSGVFFLS